LAVDTAESIAATAGRNEVLGDVVAGVAVKVIADQLVAAGRVPAHQAGTPVAAMLARADGVIEDDAVDEDDASGVGKRVVHLGATKVTARLPCATVAAQHHVKVAVAIETTTVHGA